MNIAQIRKEFREYLTELASINKLSKKDAETQYSDADYPRKHADELGMIIGIRSRIILVLNICFLCFKTNLKKKGNFLLQLYHIKEH